MLYWISNRSVPPIWPRLASRLCTLKISTPLVVWLAFALWLRVVLWRWCSSSCGRVWDFQGVAVERVVLAWAEGATRLALSPFVPPPPPSILPHLRPPPHLVRLLSSRTSMGSFVPALRGESNFVISGIVGVPWRPAQLRQPSDHKLGQSQIGGGGASNGGD
jgi:hypothetical protein